MVSPVGSAVGSPVGCTVGAAVAGSSPNEKSSTLVAVVALGVGAAAFFATRPPALFAQVGNSWTCNLSEVDQANLNAWMPIFARYADHPPPDFAQFKQGQQPIMCKHVGVILIAPKRARIAPLRAIADRGTAVRRDIRSSAAAGGPPRMPREALDDEERH